MLAEVVSLPVPERRCFNCEHSLDTTRGSYCEVFDEFILLEETAEDCEHYEVES